MCLNVVALRLLLDAPHESHAHDQSSVISPRNFMDSSGSSGTEIPTLVIVKALLRAGWQLGDEPSAHGPDTPRFLSGHVSVDRKEFYHCALLLDKILASGLPKLDGLQHKLYYSLVLRDIDNAGSVPLNLSAQEYQKLFKGEVAASSDSADSDSPIIVATPKAVVRRARKQHLAVESAMSLDDVQALLGQPASAVSDATNGAVVSGTVAKLKRKRADSSSSCGSSSSSASSTEPSAKPANELEPMVSVPGPPTDNGFRFVIDGRPIKVGQWPPLPVAGERTVYSQYEIVCPLAGDRNSGHCKCVKRRSKGPRQCMQFGQWEPIAFLLCWADLASEKPTRKEHVNSVPTTAAIRACMKAHGWLDE